MQGKRKHGDHTVTPAGSPPLPFSSPFKQLPEADIAALLSTCPIHLTGKHYSAPPNTLQSNTLSCPDPSQGRAAAISAEPQRSSLTIPFSIFDMPITCFIHVDLSLPRPLT